MNAITAEGLVKVYRSRKSEVRALDGVDLEVARRHRAWSARPERRGQDDHGADPRDAPASPTPAEPRSPASMSSARRSSCAQVIGLSGQYAAVDENLTGRENLVMFGRLYQLPKAEARTPGRRAPRAVRADRRRGSGRQDVLGRHAPPARPRQRADRPAAAALPRRADDRPRPAQPARACGTSSAALVREGATLLLTTQYLEEADELADAIAVVDHGKIIARGTSDELKAQVGGERRRGRRPRPGRPGHGRRKSSRATARVNARSSSTPGSCPCRLGRWRRVLVQVVRDLDEAGIAIDDIGLRRPTLDDVFLSLTGHAAVEAAPTMSQRRPPGGKAA